MRKALAPTFLLILGSMVLAATVFAEPVALALKPFETVLIGNDETSPVPVHEQGTVDVNVTSAVAIDPAGNTVQVSEQRFSVAAQAFSELGLGTNCVDLTTLPAGTLLIENADVHAFTGMEAYLSAPAESSAGGSYGTSAYIGVQLATYPGSFDTNGHTATSLVVHDGGLAASGPGEPTRDETHPVQICVSDDTVSSAFNSLWTISGRVVG